LGNKISVVLKAGKETLLLVSGKTAKGWRILGTRGDKVVLSYRGTEVVLPVPKPSDKTGLTRKVSSGGGITRVVSREEVRRLMGNYGELLRGVDFVPYTAGGKTEGFRIRYLSPSSIFYKLGFRTGDVIVSVNGVVLKNTDDLFRVVQIVQNEPNVRVKILRNGKPVTLDVRIE
jgi:general secretion pathway protein C